jgi:hypothetical protein
VYLVAVYDRAGELRNCVCPKFEDATDLVRVWRARWPDKQVSVYNLERMECDAETGPNDGLTAEEREQVYG